MWEASEWSKTCHFVWHVEVRQRGCASWEALGPLPGEKVANWERSCAMYSASDFDDFDSGWRVLQLLIVLRERLLTTRQVSLSVPKTKKKMTPMGRIPLLCIFVANVAREEEHIKTALTCTIFTHFYHLNQFLALYKVCGSAVAWQNQNPPGWLDWHGGAQRPWTWRCAVLLQRCPVDFVVRKFSDVFFQISRLDSREAGMTFQWRWVPDGHQLTSNAPTPQEWSSHEDSTPPRSVGSGTARCSEECPWLQEIYVSPWAARSQTVAGLPGNLPCCECAQVQITRSWHWKRFKKSCRWRKKSSGHIDIWRVLIYKWHVINLFGCRKTKISTAS